MCACDLLFYSFILLLAFITVGYIAYDIGVTRGRIIQIDKELKEL